MKNFRNNSIFYLVCALFIFLPLSSWLVSLLGTSSISLVRDVLILGIFLLAIPSLFKKVDKSYFIIAGLFLLYGVLSFFWREASVMQWLKGFRFTFLPIILFLSLVSTDFGDKQKKIIYRIVLGGGIVISLMAVLEFFRIDIPLLSSLSGGEGALESINYVGNSTLLRLQSIVAGPNALGLYMLALSAYALGSFKKISRFWPLFLILFSTILILSFSRSAIIGLLIVFFCAFILWLSKKIGPAKTTLIALIMALAISCEGYQVLNSKDAKVQNSLTHGDSSSLRFEQYKRVWDSRFEIGLLGRGSGSAGPASQFRLDNGEKRWTENIYLDVFEELGLIGLVIYLFLFLVLFRNALKITDGDEKNTALLIITSFAVSGIFINYYTGQVGIFLMWLALALILSPPKKLN